MPSEKTIWSAFIVVGCIIGVTIVVMLSGCSVMERVDEAIWKPPPSTSTSTSQPATAYGQPPAPTAPPIVEVVAGLLAAGGFGGMARWLHNIKKNSNGRMDSLNTRVTSLEGWRSRPKDRE